MARTGHCLCGAVRYELAGDVDRLTNCHCQFCRRAHGAAFATTALVATKDLRVIAGEDVIVRHEGRHFCGACGTRLYNRGQSSPGATSLVVASLDEDPTESPVAHVNVESKAAWYEILDDKPQYPGFPPGVDAAMKAKSGEGE